MKKTREKVFIVVLILLFVPFLTGGIMSINPATEEEELVLISAEKERKMGRNISEKVEEHFDLPVDPLMQERIQRIGDRLAFCSDRKDVVYRFKVLDHEKDNMYNAFAVPGGYVYIFTDLVEVMKTDDKIAAVLAHEMGHIEAKHSVKRMQGSLGAALFMLLGAQIESEKKFHAEVSRAVGYLMAAYSRHDERQADDLSIKYLRSAGFDPAGAVGSLKVLKALRKKAPRMKYFPYKSHPYISERIAHLNNRFKGYTDFNSYINTVQRKNEL